MFFPLLFVGQSMAAGGGARKRGRRGPNFERNFGLMIFQESRHSGFYGKVLIN